MTSVAADRLEAVPTVHRTLLRCIDKGLTRSAQVSVAHHGEVVVSDALGRTSLGQPASTATSYLWSCATKPLVAIVVGTLLDDGAFTLGAPVGRFLPELPVPVADITVRQLLTHMAGLGDAGAQAYFPLGRGLRRGDDEAALAEIADVDPDPLVHLGERAGYSVFTNWFLLSLVIERVTGVPCDEVIHQRVVAPLGIAARLWLTQDDVRSLDRAPFEIAWEDVATRILQRSDHADGPTPADGSELLDGSTPHLYTPGSSGVGPISSLVAVLDAVMADADDGGRRLLHRTMAQQLVAPQRVGVVDTVTGNDFGWGLGLCVDNRAFSPRLAPATFGHLGWDSSCIVFADPALDVVAGVAFDRQLSGYDGVLRHGAVVGALTTDLDDMGLV